MTCRKANILISKYIDGKLTKSDKTKLEEHIADCAVCRHEMSMCKIAVDGVHKFGVVEVPESFEDAVLNKIQKFNAEYKTVKQVKECKLRLSWAFICACIFTLVGVGLYACWHSYSNRVSGFISSLYNTVAGFTSDISAGLAYMIAEISERFGNLLPVSNAHVQIVFYVIFLVLLTSYIVYNAAVKRKRPDKQCGVFGITPEQLN